MIILAFSGMDCGSAGRGFEPRLSPMLKTLVFPMNSRVFLFSDPSIRDKNKLLA